MWKPRAASRWKCASKAYKRLEYRGYDSAGAALTAPGMDHVEARKKAGRLANLMKTRNAV